MLPFPEETIHVLESMCLRDSVFSPTQIKERGSIFTKWALPFTVQLLTLFRICSFIDRVPRVSLSLYFNSCWHIWETYGMTTSYSLYVKFWQCKHYKHCTELEALKKNWEQCCHRHIQTYSCFSQSASIFSEKLVWYVYRWSERTAL